MPSFAVTVEGVETLREVASRQGDYGVNAARAINSTLNKQRTHAARIIEQRVNLPSSYLSPSSGNLVVSQRAKRSSLEGRITARGRPTSLARFVTGSISPGKAGVTVSVKPGKARRLRKAFPVRLPGVGGSTDAGKFNTGLAIRLRPGERLSNKTHQVKLSKGLYLLYGPSVQQVFLNNSGKGVAEDISGQTAEEVETEFLRLMAL